ncbi:MAG: hypothetical protein LBP28_01000 [Coriobacteriales bacterium]|nr:hypothetical protein [Coriobacteriales bacterium]
MGNDIFHTVEDDNATAGSEAFIANANAAVADTEGLPGFSRRGFALGAAALLGAGLSGLWGGLGGRSAFA